MRDIELVVTDLDGTLWHTSDEIHPDVGIALKEVLRRGMPLLVATGRRVTSTRVPLATLGVSPSAVVLNGALGLDLATNVRFHRAPFPAQQATEVLEHFRACGLDPCIYVDDDAAEVCVGTTPSTNPRHLQALGASVVFTDLDCVVRDVAVLAFSVIGAPHAELAPAYKALEGVAAAHLDRALEFPGLAAITAAPLGLSKWDGVEAFCRARGLDATRVLAIGDGPNDVELLVNAAVAVVPENAHPAALAHADEVIPPAREGGWAAVVDLLDGV